MRVRVRLRVRVRGGIRVGRRVWVRVRVRVSVRVWARFRVRVRIRVRVRVRVGVRVRVRVRVWVVIKPIPLSNYPLPRKGILFGGPAMEKSLDTRRRYGTHPLSRNHIRILFLTCSLKHYCLGNLLEAEAVKCSLGLGLGLG